MLSITSHGRLMESLFAVAQVCVCWGGGEYTACRKDLTIPLESDELIGGQNLYP